MEEKRPKNGFSGLKIEYLPPIIETNNENRIFTLQPMSERRSFARLKACQFSTSGPEVLLFFLFLFLEN